MIGRFDLASPPKREKIGGVGGDKIGKMPNWYFDRISLRKTPSILDGISYDTEQRYRREGARFITKVGTKMNLRYDTMATGVVYFHRFYTCHSFKQFPRFATAACCLFLAGKVEETPKKCKDIIRTARQYLTVAQFAAFGEVPKEEVLTLERILLQTINFDLQVDHPYTYLIKYAKCLKGDKEKLQKVVQMAWTFINDSLCTTICLQWEPEIIAIALFFLAGKLSRFEVVDWDGRLPHHKRWWEAFVEDLTVDLLEDICHQVLDLYSFPIPDTPQDSPPSSPAPALDPALVSKQGSPAVKRPASARGPTINQETTLPRAAPPPLPPPPPPPPPLLQAQLLGSSLSGMVETSSNLISVTTSSRFVVSPNVQPIASQATLITASSNVKLPSAIPTITSMPTSSSLLTASSLISPSQPFSNIGNQRFPLGGHYSLPQAGSATSLTMANNPPQPQLSVPGTTWEFAPHQSYVNYRFPMADHKQLDHK